MNWEKICPNLKFAGKNKIGNFKLNIMNEIKKNWEKCVFLWEERNFEHIGNSVHTADFSALGKALNIYIDSLIFCPSRQHVK